MKDVVYAYPNGGEQFPNLEEFFAMAKKKVENESDTTSNPENKMVCFLFNVKIIII